MSNTDITLDRMGASKHPLASATGGGEGSFHGKWEQRSCLTSGEKVQMWREA